MDSNMSLPYNEEAEKAFLGVLLNNTSVLSMLENKPNERDFYFERHRVIFSAILRFWDTEEKIDVIAVTEELSSQKKLHISGGFSYISSLLDKGITVEGLIEYYAQIIIQKSQRRRLMKLSGEMFSWAQDESKDVLGVIEECEKKIFEVTNQAQTKMYQEAQYFHQKFYRMVESRIDQPEGIFSGIITGFSKLDSYLSGLQNGELIILAARTSVGKTAFALQLVKNISYDKNIATGFFSLEMKGSEIISRLVCQLTGLDGQKIRQNMLNNAELQHISKITSQYADVPFFISDIERLSLFDLKVQARRLVHREGVKIIFIDYIGLISYYHHLHDDAFQGRSMLPRYEQYSEISRTLKMIARELDIPIIVLAQLNREVKGEKTPSLAHIRDSGSIEQDADVVLLMHKEENANIIKINIAKQRNGPTGTLTYRFSKLSFTEIDQSTPIDNNPYP